MIKKVISFTERMVEMVQEIQIAKGYVSFSAVVHQAIIDMHQSCFPNYLRKQSDPESPDDRVRRKKEEKEAKLELQMEVYRDIATSLGGEIIEEGGKEYCRYFTYTGKKRFEQKVPLTLLSTDLIINQYQPSKEKVESLQKEGKVDY